MKTDSCLQTCDSCIHHCASKYCGTPDFCWERISEANGWLSYWERVAKWYPCKHYIETSKHYKERIAQENNNA